MVVEHTLADQAPRRPFVGTAAKVAAVLESFTWDEVDCDFSREVRLRMLVRTVARQLGAAPDRTDDAWAHPAAIVRLLRRLRTDPADALSLNMAAAELGLSPAATIRAIRGSTGVTPAALVAEARARRAVELLRRSPRLSIAEVSARFGYASPSHLNAVVRRYLGTTPGRARLSSDA